MTTEVKDTVVETQATETQATELITTAAERRAAAKAAVLAAQGEAKPTAVNEISKDAFENYLGNIGSTQELHDRVLGERGDFVAGAVDAHAQMAVNFLTAETDAKNIQTNIPMGGRGNQVEIVTHRSSEQPGGPGKPRVTVAGHTQATVRQLATSPSKNKDLHTALNDATGSIASALEEYMNK